MKEFIKYHKVPFIIGAIILVLIFILLVLSLVIPNYGTNLYGDRLDGMTEVKDQTLASIEEKIKTNASVLDAITHVQGRIINFYITLNTNPNEELTSVASTLILNHLEEVIQADYDVQVFLVSDVEESQAMIGYMHKTLSSFSWSIG